MSHGVCTWLEEYKKWYPQQPIGLSVVIVSRCAWRAGIWAIERSSQVPCHGPCQEPLI